MEYRLLIQYSGFSEVTIDADNVKDAIQKAIFEYSDVRPEQFDIDSVTHHSDDSGVDDYTVIL
jgi:hypothetical protein